MATIEKDANAPIDANIVTKGAYADLKGVSKSRVSQWAKANRLVLTDDGRVMVAESDARLELISSPRGATNPRWTAWPSSSLLGFGRVRETGTEFPLFLSYLFSRSVLIGKVCQSPKVSQKGLAKSELMHIAAGNRGKHEH